MTSSALLELLAEVERGTLTPEAAAQRLATLPFEDLGHARVDHHRSLRIGLPEVVFAAGKTAEQTVAIFSSLAADGVDVLATRVEPATAQAILAAHPAASHNAVARTVALRQSVGASGTGASEMKGHVAVICAGTSDLPIAEEAAVTAETFGARVTRLYDVGVAGLHRLLAVRDDLKSANAIIVCAGMEGALPSVVGGLVAVPVIAVPTSVGYGASFGGAAALLGMLNSCSPNVTVVNIDNGFGAAYTAVLIARGAAHTRQ
ncbi:MAG: nickel pincer cofactor biosynthesis protein LarB [Acidobacteriaceae bacterium]|jgi:NCAIR mutase (PurE)-related protein